MKACPMHDIDHPHIEYLSTLVSELGVLHQVVRALSKAANPIHRRLILASACEDYPFLLVYFRAAYASSRVYRLTRKDIGAYYGQPIDTDRPPMGLWLLLTKLQFKRITRADAIREWRLMLHYVPVHFHYLCYGILHKNLPCRVSIDLLNDVLVELGHAEVE